MLLNTSLLICASREKIANGLTKQAAHDPYSYNSDDTIPDETGDTTMSACSCGISQNNDHLRDSSRDQTMPASSPSAPRHPDIGF